MSGERLQDHWSSGLFILPIIIIIRYYDKVGKVGISIQCQNLEFPNIVCARIQDSFMGVRCG